MLERRGQRTRAELEADAQLQANRQAAQARSAQLTEAMERLKAKFTDEAVAFEYDVKNLLQKQQAVLANSDGEDNNTESSKTLPCLGPRVHWIDCQKKYALDSRPCDSHLQAMENCIRQSILKE